MTEVVLAEAEQNGRVRTLTTTHRGLFADVLKHVLLSTYVVASVAAAMAVIGSLYIHDGFSLNEPLIAAMFTVLLIAAELVPLRWLKINESSEITASWAFAFALLLVESTLVAIVAMAGASILADLVHRKKFTRVTFNAAQLALSLGAAGFVLDLVDQRNVLHQAGGSIGPMWLVGVAGAGFTLLFVNSVMMWTALTLSDEMTLAQILSRGLTTNSQSDGALVAVAPSVVVVSQRSALLLPMALVTAFIIHRVARRALVREHEASHDSLTDLLNRRAFLERLDTVIAASDRKSRCRAILVLDLDGFKSVNDMLGHHIGDQILCEVAARITSMHGPGQMTARLGGDEFATLMLHVNSYEDAMDWARQLHRALAQPYTNFGFPVQLTASIGVAVLSEEHDSSESLLRAADIAMYAAKRDSLGVQLQTHQDTGNELGRLNLIAELSGSIDRGELFVEYQPQASCTSGAVYGIEALLRWQHPRLGLIQPGDFITLAEQTELMQPITQFVLRRALSDLAGWRARGWNLRIAVNVSAQNLHNPQFPAIVAEVLAQLGLPGSVLELEITENAVMTKREVIRDVLRELRELGTRIVIDDFGTGYSSLANMRHLPLDGVKIDRSFIHDLDTDHDDLVIVSSIIELARNLHLETTAEGVESAASWRRLSQLGCDNIQGYLLARPMTAPRLYTWLQRCETERTLEVRESRPRLQLVNNA
jgi:diguanylate cyclase (GGDEF)-like protein